MANYKVAYGKRDDVEYAIESGIIPPGCIIITEDSFEIFFYDLSRRLKTYQERYKFESLEEAEEWLEDHTCSGQIFSVHDEVEGCNLYLVDYENKLEKVEKTSLSCFEHIQPTSSAKWDIQHDLGTYPTVTTLDALGNLIVGETTYLDSNRVIVSFSEPISGKAYLK